MSRLRREAFLSEKELSMSDCTSSAIGRQRTDSGWSYGGRNRLFVAPPSPGATFGVFPCGASRRVRPLFSCWWGFGGGEPPPGAALPPRRPLFWLRWPGLPILNLGGGLPGATLGLQLRSLDSGASRPGRAR